MSVVGVIPDSSEISQVGQVVSKYVKYFNSKTGQIRDTKAGELKLKANEKLCIFVQLVCQDQSLQFSNRFARVNLIQNDALGFFCGIDPKDLVAAETKKSKPV
jgi:hypothetical protein